MSTRVQNVAEREPEQPVASDAAPDKGIVIEKDGNFFRYFADDILPLDRGDNVDLMFMVYGPDPTFQRSRADDDGTSAIRLTPSLTEIGRVRVPDSASGNAAIAMIRRLSGSGKLVKARLREAFESILADMPDDEAADD